MRAKSFPISSSRNSLDPSPSLPERFGSGVSTTHDDEIVPDNFDVGDVLHKKKRHCTGTSETDLINVHACIVCDVSDECVSRCCGIDCPVSFHKECLDTEFGGSEDPFCPYCWFKIVAVKSKALRDKAIEAEKTVFKYVDKEMESEDEVEESVPKCQEDTELCGDEDGDQDQEHSVESTDIVSDIELQGEKATPLSKEKQVQVDKDSDKSPLTDQPEGDKGKLEVGAGKSGEMKADEVNEASEDEERVATESIEDDEDDETAEHQTKVNNKGAGKKGDVSPALSMQESFSGKEDDLVQQNENRRRIRRELKLNATDSKERVATENIQNDEDDETAEDQMKVSKVAGKKRDVSPVLSTQELFKGKEHDQVQRNETQRRRRRLILNATDSEFSSTKERNGEDVTEEITSSTKVAKSKKVARGISFFNKDQRRRLLWKPEEEEMLKVGVEKFAAEANKNMPWKKILEMGENVFHETRTPADLKDKWRNMIRLGQLREKLSGGQFRMLNEKLYTCSGKEALAYFKEDPDMFDMYHTGYQQQMSNWPELPVNSIINWLLSRSSSLVVADFGCGDARIAKSVKNKVFSFDLVSKNPSVIACDMSNTPLESSSVDVAVFCLSLMGTNYSSYINEAYRVLRPSGWLLIAEVKSRFDPNNGGADPKDFVKAVCNLGFTSVLKDFSNKMFILWHFQKKEQLNSNEKKIKWPELKACLYKRR
ncbi:unnamed protein product [Arabis nemorensis]|uniref:Ribosomal RNA-processing protein 8 n=1 Tax=Arabis nemorensis TaxID=586526 RepID=A0A565C6Z1_9BRAS|nr:unnamed protein product [Arabis nemorensis]